MNILKRIWNHIEEHWMRYTCIFFILFPFFIGALTACNKFVPWSIAGEPKDWLSFWGSYISGIASFVMIWIAWKTLVESKESNRPFIYAKVTKRLGKIYLVLENVGKTPALNLIITFNQLDEATKIFSNNINDLNIALPADKIQKIFLCFNELTTASSLFITEADVKKNTIIFFGKKYSFEEYNNLYNQFSKNVNTITIKYNQYIQTTPIDIQNPEEEKQDLLLIIARRLEGIENNIKSLNSKQNN